MQSKIPSECQESRWQITLTAHKDCFTGDHRLKFVSGLSFSALLIMHGLLYTLCTPCFYTAHPDCRREQITWYVSISATTMAAIHLFLWMCESCLRHALSCENLLRTEETKEQTWVTGTEVTRASQTLPIATPWSRWSLLCSGTGKLF